MLRAVLLVLLGAFSAESQRALSVDLVLSHHGEPAKAVQAFVDSLHRALPASASLNRVFVLAHSSKVPDGLPRAWSKHALGRSQAGDSLSLLSFLEHHLHGERWVPAHFLIFAPAAPSAEQQTVLRRRLPLLTESTGLLALGLVSRAACSGEPATTAGLEPLLFALHFATTHRFCHGSTEGWAVFGDAFVVSHRRAALQPHSLYRALRQQLELPEGHWIHSGESSITQPMLGTAIEQSVNLLFNCTAPVACPDGTSCQCVESEGAGGHWLDHSAIQH